MEPRVEKIKLIAGRYKIPVTLTYQGDRIFVSFAYNPILLNEVRNMDGAHWHGYDEKNPRKIWSIANSLRNQFQLKFLMGENVYQDYDKPLIDYKSSRTVYDHQLLATRFFLTRHYCILAGEMGTGKTLAAIEAAEASGIDSKDIWYIGPKAGVRAFRRELAKWDSKIMPNVYTYEELVKLMRYWDAGTPAPRMVIFDESSKIKTPTSQRSQAALFLANAVRSEHGDKGYVFLMSGTPAPKAPTDWWHQCEVCCPGYLKEGNVGKFRISLSIVEQNQNSTGGVYSKLITWLDNDKKCKKCGDFEDASQHNPINMMDTDYHAFAPSVNEIDRLYRRMNGLVLVQFKKDCLDLPDKTYEVLNIKPTQEILQVARTIKQTARRVVESLTLLRELSDGFQYQKTVVGREVCPNCGGKKTVNTYAATPDQVANYTIGVNDKKEEQLCVPCGGTGEVDKIETTVLDVGSPKDEILKEFLDEHDDVGRFIVWGGFTATVDRIVQIAHQCGWAVLRVDGRGYCGTNYNGDPLDSDVLLDCMDGSNPHSKELLEKYPKVCFVGQPEAGGMALTLTASPTELFYSNSFSGTARMQAEDRFHRAGMDTTRGARIVDLIHLPTDRLVLDNLLKKKDLQALSLGELDRCFG